MVMYCVVYLLILGSVCRVVSVGVSGISGLSCRFLLLMVWVSFMMVVVWLVWRLVCVDSVCVLMFVSVVVFGNVIDSFLCDCGNDML